MKVAWFSCKAAHSSSSPSCKGHCPWPGYKLFIFFSIVSTISIIIIFINLLSSSPLSSLWLQPWGHWPLLVGKDELLNTIYMICKSSSCQIIIIIIIITLLEHDCCHLLTHQIMIISTPNHKYCWFKSHDISSSMMMIHHHWFTIALYHLCLTIIIS